MLQRERNAAVEVEYLGAEQVVVFGLKAVGHGFHPRRTRFVVLGGVGLAVGVFLLHQQEGSLCRFVGGAAAAVLCFGIDGVVVGLLYLLVEGFLAFLQLPVVGVLLDACTPYTVAGAEAVEDGNAERESDVLAEVVAQL